MEEDIKILKEFITEGGRDWKCIDCGFNCKGELQAIENILNRLEQLEKENEELKHNNKIIEINALQLAETNKYLRENSIPKSVIREEIEKLERDTEKIREKKKAANDYDRSKARMQAYLTKTNEIKKRLEELLGE